ncbi:phage-related protein, tail component (plasmid) [Methylobacterium aquaticum]|uniref:Phage-related protein, tail component n=1 Tax=Methylobacterium aquaticum TaxID=270351 RepID=A0A0C6FC94_9HYPH|nr:phage-related protein, tail component [Methylobacterium aquaticum]
MLRRIHLHGTLKSIHSGPIEVHAASPAEALKAITRQVKGFGGNAVTGPLRVKVLGHETIEDLIAVGGARDLHLFPQLNGGKNGGFFQILIGAVLVAASFIAGPLIGPILLKIGIVMILGGILQLFNTPKRDNKDKEEKKSHYLGAPKNTVEIGTRIPILCGEDLVGGHYLSFNIDAVDTGVV